MKHRIVKKYHPFSDSWVYVLQACISEKKLFFRPKKIWVNLKWDDKILVTFDVFVAQAWFRVYEADTLIENPINYELKIVEDADMFFRG